METTNKIAFKFQFFIEKQLKVGGREKLKLRSLFEFGGNFFEEGQLSYFTIDETIGVFLKFLIDLDIFRTAIGRWIRTIVH